MLSLLVSELFVINSWLNNLPGDASDDIDIAVLKQQIQSARIGPVATTTIQIRYYCAIGIKIIFIMCEFLRFGRCRP